MTCSVSQVRNEFYKDSQGVLLVYDVGVRESFEALDSWLGEMKQEMGSQANMDSIVFIVCANKVISISGRPKNLPPISGLESCFIETHIVTLRSGLYRWT